MNRAIITAWIGVGANLGDAQGAVCRAMDGLERHPDLEPLARSALYRTEPVGPVPQPWFINAVIGVRTRLSAEGLLALLQQLETHLGRRRHQEESRWGPRLMDLDLLDFGGEIRQSTPPLLPHLHLHQRRFVLVPLAQVAPGWVHPLRGKSVDTLLQEVDDDSRVELLPGSVPTFHRDAATQPE